MIPEIPDVIFGYEIKTIYIVIAFVLGPVIGYFLGMMKGRPLHGFFWGIFNLPGWLIFLFTMRGLITCPSCGKKTPWYPKPDMTEGMSEPHLRCRSCGTIIG